MDRGVYLQELRSENRGRRQEEEINETLRAHREEEEEGKPIQ